MGWAKNFETGVISQFFRYFIIKKTLNNSCKVCMQDWDRKIIYDVIQSMLYFLFMFVICLLILYIFIYIFFVILY